MYRKKRETVATKKTSFENDVSRKNYHSITGVSQKRWVIKWLTIIPIQINKNVKEKTGFR